MKKESLEEFLIKKKAKNETQLKAMNWDKRKQKWLQSIDTLYKQVEEWLSNLKKKGVVKISYKEEMIFEEHIGQYNIKKMYLDVGSERVTLSPKGTFVVGAYGRVDLIGDEGSIMIVMLKWGEWFIASRTPAVKYWPLTKGSFSDALKQVM